MISLMADTASTITSGMTARYGEMMAACGMSATQAMKRKKKLDARPNCSKKNLGKKVTALYLVVEMLLLGKLRMLASRL